VGLVFLCVYLRKYLVGSLQWVGRPICVCAAALAPLRRELINKYDQIDNLIFFCFLTAVSEPSKIEPTNKHSSSLGEIYTQHSQARNVLSQK
jgi:hypothetical protein